MKFILITLLLFVVSISDAMSACSDDFKKIDLQCIGLKRNEMNNVAFEVHKKNVGNTYFYQTENNYLGKMKVLSVINNSNECVLYIDTISFHKGGSFNPTSSLSITKDYNVWSKATGSLEQRGRSNDFKLTRKGNKCILESVNAKAVFYKKMENEQLKEGKEILKWFAFLLIGLAAFLISKTIFAEEEKFAAEAKLDDTDSDESESKKKLNKHIVLRYSKPFFKRYFSPIVQNMSRKRKIKEKYKRKLAAAGMTKDLSPEDFFAFKLFLIIGAPIVFLITRAFLEETWPLSLVPVVSIVGFYYPNIWLNSCTTVRRKEITFAMPFVVDLLALSVEAGLDFMAAMQRVMEKAPKSALVDEFETVIKETRIGSSRAEALRQLSWRVNTMEMSSFCATLIAADSVGASIGPILKTLAGEMRGKKSAEIEKAGAQAASKLIIPAILFIIPAVFIIVVAPIAFQMMGGN